MTTLLCVSGAFKVEIEVEQTFDEAVEQLYPIHPPASSLEVRSMMTWIDTDTGKRVTVPPQAVFSIKES